jgi:hypothetical protein
MLGQQHWLLVFCRFRHRWLKEQQVWRRLDLSSYLCLRRKEMTHPNLGLLLFIGLNYVMHACWTKPSLFGLFFFWVIFLGL